MRRALVWNAKEVLGGHAGKEYHIYIYFLAVISEAQNTLRKYLIWRSNHLEGEAVAPSGGCCNSPAVT